jgi:hypothetical protein
VFHAATSEHQGTYVKFGAVSGRVIFFQPPPPPSGQEGYGESYFSRSVFFGGGMKIWIYTGDMDLFQFNTFISVFIYFYYKLCPATDVIIRSINFLGAESKLIGSFALILQNAVLRPGVVTYLAN